MVQITEVLSQEQSTGTRGRRKALLSKLSKQKPSNNGAGRGRPAAQNDTSRRGGEAQGLEGPLALTFAPAKQFFRRYQVHEQIGSGSYGTVWRCTDKDTGDEVACKQINKKQGMGSIIDELDCLTRAQGCEFVLRLVGVYESELYVYLVTEQCNGGDLFDYLQKEGHMEEQDAKVLFAQVLEALHHCHHRGVLHRDIKPENVLLHVCPTTGQRSARLADFGLACRLRSGETAKGWVGSEPYEAPEVMASKPYGLSADVFSLGVVLFGMLSANWPHFSEGRAFDSKRNFWRRGWKGVSAEGKDLLTRMMSVDPEKRPSTTQILAGPWLSSRTEVSTTFAETPEAVASIISSWQPLSFGSEHNATSARAEGADKAVWVSPDAELAQGCKPPVNVEDITHSMGAGDAMDELPSPVGSEFNISWAASGDSSRCGSCEH